MAELLTTLRNLAKNNLQTLDDYFSLAKGQFQSADLSIFHQFAPPPAGGGHQFLRALWHEAEARGLRVENNSISRTTQACLFNSFNFDENRLRRLRRNAVIYVHRVDGPIDVYRGRNEGVDQRIWQMNQQFADKTIFQSRYSQEKHLDLGLEFRDPTVILNAVDPDIFHPQSRAPFSRERKIRLIAASWSDNPKKGATVYAWLDEHLDWERFDFTFVGRSPVQFKHIHQVAPVPSTQLANYLRQHDLYLTASQDDPCSNSLLEALNCGCPAIYLKSGGHPEIVKGAGLGFDSPEEIPGLLAQMAVNYEAYQSRIETLSLVEVTTLYLKTLEII
jgi:glycosyltransferase involved in cell wall biosynthesis